ncbi:Hypothetical protein R9X50_00193000 [Acrodontium crateriforme]|uniref:Major facilitator superfamily (MFS) profile domain-containing protein n=1 Tax=Acrodontium crateriforme TaxID=150365 RepID=A0AAQ3M1K9_9PEZI|nr:Hypothetical protein R9X50_00193000 [Acrodontium crateriforme]
MQSGIPPGEMEAELKGDLRDNNEESLNETTESVHVDSKDEEKQPAKPEQPVWVNGLQLWLIMFAITLVCFLMLLDIAILSTATPKITSQFHSLVDVGWYGAAYQLASASMQPLTGKIYSNFNLKWTFFAFIVLFEFGSLLCGVATSSNMLIVGRAVAGMGGSGLQNGALTIISACVPMHKRPALLGVIMGFAQLGIVGGPLIGGLFTEYVTWRWCFYLNLPLGALAVTFLTFLQIPELSVKEPPMKVLRDIHNKLDLVGFVIFAPAAVMLLLALQWGGNQYPWNSSVVIGLFCSAGATFLVWLAWDYYKKDKAMIPLSMLRKQHVWVSGVSMGFLSSSMTILSYYLPIYFQSVRGKSAAISGVYLLPGILSQLIGAVSSGKLVGKFGYYLPWAVASGVLTAVGYGALSTLNPTSSTGKWIGFQIIAGIGRGFGLQMPLVAVQNTIAPAQIPTAMALIMFSQTFFGALFLSFSDTIFTNSLRSLLHQDAPNVDAQAVIKAGAYGFRQIVKPELLSGVLNAYSGSIDRIFYLCASLATGCFFLAWGMGWVDIREKKQPTKPQESK